MSRINSLKTGSGWASLTAVITVTALLLGCGLPTHAGEYNARGGQLLFDGQGMQQSKAKLAQGDAYLQAILDDIIKEADKYLDVQPVSVADKPMTPPSGDKHDYMSMSPYWWPNPDTADGKPYIRRDGEYNPERSNYDVPKLDTATNAVRQLALAYYFTGEEKYAEHAAKHLRHFFINPDTRMNPNLQFGQFVPGVAENGRKSGIIETVRLRFVPDSIIMLKRSQHWTDEDHQAMKQWFGDYVQWLRTSKHGTEEAEAENNHGSWYAQQVVLYALFAGDEDTARDVIATVPPRIDAQIEPDGSQPEENRRTRSLHYCDFNNRALMDVARLAEPLGIDIWNYQADDGGSLKKSLDYVAPYMVGEKPWPHTQIDELKYQWFAQTFRWAGIGWNDSSYEAQIDKLPNRFGENAWIELVVPAQ